MLIVLRGLQIGITGGQNLFELPQSVLYLGNARLARRCRPRSGSARLLFAVGIVVLGFFRHGPGGLRDRRQRSTPRARPASAPTG